MSALYYKFSEYFRQLGYGSRVQKISVNAGFSCPNRDGRISDAGCIFCNNEGFSPSASKRALTVAGQISGSMEFLKKRYKTDKFVVYFQPFTNTYAPLPRLKEAYDSIISFKEVVGISIGTRPDCVDKDIIELINSYTDKYDVWIEYGLQSIHDPTLEKINRGHKYKDFLNAVGLTRSCPKIKICAHAILGLPDETGAMMFETAREMAKLKIDGIKLHPLHVVKGTELEKACAAGGTTLLTIEEYAELASGFLQRLWPKTVIQRVTADCPKNLLVGPSWINEKSRVLSMIDECLKKDNACQGKLFE
jgi:radical SAM protein (TIGR01212 family)